MLYHVRRWMVPPKTLLEPGWQHTRVEEEQN